MHIKVCEALGAETPRFVPMESNARVSTYSTLEMKPFSKNDYTKTAPDEDEGSAILRRHQFWVSTSKLRRPGRCKTVSQGGFPFRFPAYPLHLQHLFVQIHVSAWQHASFTSRSSLSNLAVQVC